MVTKALTLLPPFLLANWILRRLARRAAPGRLHLRHLRLSNERMVRGAGGGGGGQPVGDPLRRPIAYKSPSREEGRKRPFLNARRIPGVAKVIPLEDPRR